jgi:hypothetical protein
MDTESPRKLVRHYTVKNGRILDPGPFEGAPQYAPLFHGLWVDGLADTVDGDTALFWVSESDTKFFPELVGYTLVALWLNEDARVVAMPLSHIDVPN